MSRLRWIYGVTLVPERQDLCAQTLYSLAQAGFPHPHLFQDGIRLDKSYRGHTAHELRLRTHGTWILALLELYVTSPPADRYALFQDDLLACTNLRRYLEECTYPDQGYWNLYTFPENQRLAKKTPHGGTVDGWYLSNQKGRGAVGLVFNQQAVEVLLTSSHMLHRPTNPDRGWRAVDGGILESFRKAGWKEYVHSPSLLQHTGSTSSMGNSPHEQATSFRGTEWDALTLLAEGVGNEQTV